MNLTDADRAILDELKKGRATKALLRDETGYSGQHIYNRLRLLAAHGYVDNIHEGSSLWELADDPRDSNGGDIPDLDEEDAEDVPTEDSSES